MSEPVSARTPRDNFIRATVHDDAFNVRAAAEDDPDSRSVLYGHFARFNEWTEIDSFFEGHFMERFAPGAFKKTIDEGRGKIRMLFQHGRDPEIGDRPIGEITELREDDLGAYYEARLLDGLPTLIVEGLRAGLYGASMRFKSMRERENQDPERSEMNPDGILERTVVEARVPEFGPVTFPQYANASAGLRSLTDEFVFEWIKREPARARELIGSVDIAPVTADPDPDIALAPSPEAAAVKAPPDVERRDHTTYLYGMGKERPAWRL
jgi:HK97 family phage prohead protease